MSESEKLQQTIGEFETEVATLETDIATLEQQLITATTTAETAIATAERRADKASQAAAVDAEQERSRLTTAIGRKRLALQAANADLAAARHGAAASQKAAALVQLQTMLDELAVVVQAVDDAPTDLTAWATLKQQVDAAGRLYRSLGGTTPLFNGDLGAMAQAVFAGHAQAVGIALRESPRGPQDAEIPLVAGLLRLNRAHARVRELGSN